MVRSAVTVQLPFEALTPLSTVSPPTAKTIRRLKKEVYACALFIDSDAGGGQHGCLGMVMTAAEYAAHLTAGGHAVVAWIDPPNPAAPVFPAAVAHWQVAHDMANYDMEKDDYSITQTLEGKLRKMILIAVPNMYLNALADPMTGFAGVRVRVMLNHLTVQYGTITTEDLEQNEQDLAMTWDPNEATDKVFDNATECQAFATAANDPITDNKAMREILKTFKKSGVMHDGIKDWKKKAAAAQTLANMRTHFCDANKRRLENDTAALQGYGTANAATGTNAGAGTITMTTEDLQRLLDMQSANAAAQRTTTNGVPPVPPPTGAGGSSYHYCWTHGLSLNPNHTSATCNRQAPGHQTAATLMNMMGGNNTIARRRGERAIYRRPQRPNDSGN